MQFVDASGRVVQGTNPVPLSIAPTFSAPTVVPNADGFLITINCVPDVLPNQSASLALGAMAVPAQIFDVQTATLSFQFPSILTSGQHLARLRIDGVESPVNVNWTAIPPAFTGPWVTV
jgi:hypothetical protein